MRRILVVDDNTKITEVLAAYLRSEGFEPIVAADGTAGLALAQKTRPDLALLDIMMPGLDGLELTRRLQASYDLPVILVTARSDEQDRLVGLEIGADDYIPKPFSPREVVARVKAVLRRSDRAAASGDQIELDGLSLDLGTRTVAVDGVRTELTRTEFDILAAMAKHPGRVYTRLQLMEAASGEAFEGYERTIDAHVKNVRRKLGDQAREPRFVETVFGVGYKVLAP